MKRRTLAVAVFAAAMFIAAVAFAQGGMMQGQQKPMKMDPMMGPMMGLNLTEDQQAKLAEMKVKHQMEMVDLNAQIKKLRLEIKQEIMKAQPSKKTILELVDKVNAIKGKVAAKRVEHLFALKSVLTPEQWKKVAARFPMFHGRGMMGGRGMEGCRGMRGKGMMNPSMMGGCRGMHGAPGGRGGAAGRMMQ